MTQVLVFVAVAAGAAVAIVAVYVVVLSVMMRARRPEEAGFEYVYIEDDGSAREVTEVERRRLTTEYAQGDSRRPYIKLRYESRDAEGRRRGFLRRRQLPPGIAIHEQ